MRSSNEELKTALIDYCRKATDEEHGDMQNLSYALVPAFCRALAKVGESGYGRKEFEALERLTFDGGQGSNDQRCREALRSCALPADDAEALIGLMDQGDYGFFSSNEAQNHFNQVSDRDARDYLKMCIEVEALDDEREDEIYSAAERLLSRKGGETLRNIGTSLGSAPLHFLKPRPFPIFNGNEGAKQRLYQVLGGRQVKRPDDLAHYVPNARAVRKVMEDNGFDFSLRVLDRAQDHDERVRELLFHGASRRPSYWYIRTKNGIEGERGFGDSEVDELLFALESPFGEPFEFYDAESGEIRNVSLEWVLENIEEGDPVVYHRSAAGDPAYYNPFCEVSGIDDSGQSILVRCDNVHIDSNVRDSLVRDEVVEGVVRHMSRSLSGSHPRLARISEGQYRRFCELCGQGAADETSPTQGGLVDSLAELLGRSYNVVLHGAPGTGKTRLARQVAAKVIGCDEGELEGSGRFGFVQFHPSYDYTDFVEGLRPVSREGESASGIGFELRPGTFMSFIDKARRSEGGGGSADTVFDEAWDKLHEKVEESDGYEFSLLQPGKTQGLITTETGFLLTRASHAYLNRNRAFKWWAHKDVSPYYGNYYRALILHMQSEFGLPEYDDAASSRNWESKKYVFVIDEINRGDISKIFGELFYSIDPGYRGNVGAVETQYANLHEDANYLFADGFYIPDNVYIIGTMNDIDRSVDSFDYAMRRRFAFREIEAGDTEYMLDGRPRADRAKAMLRALNAEIAAADGLGHRYELGASYFIGYAEGAESAEELWGFRVEPLLKEYLHDAGMGRGEIDRFRKAFFGHANGGASENSDWAGGR